MCVCVPVGKGSNEAYGEFKWGRGMRKDGRGFIVKGLEGFVMELLNGG